MVSRGVQQPRMVRRRPWRSGLAETLTLPKRQSAARAAATTASWWGPWSTWKKRSTWRCAEKRGAEKKGKTRGSGQEWFSAPRSRGGRSASCAAARSERREHRSAAREFGSHLVVEVLVGWGTG